MRGQRHRTKFLCSSTPVMSQRGSVIAAGRVSPETEWGFLHSFVLVCPLFSVTFPLLVKFFSKTIGLTHFIFIKGCSQFILWGKKQLWKNYEFFLERYRRNIQKGIHQGVNFLLWIMIALIICNDARSNFFLLFIWVIPPQMIYPLKT